MSDHKVLIFGSFTEDETRLFQRHSVNNHVIPSESSDLQFGSVDSASLNSIKRNAESKQSAESKQTVPAVRSKDVQAPNHTTKITTIKNGKAPVSCNLQNATEVQAKGFPNGGSSVSGVLGNGKNSLDLNLTHISEKTDNVELLITSVKVNDNGFERLKDGNNSLNTSEVVAPVVDRQRKLSEQVPLVAGLLPRGLINLGNLCFLNATLQALLSCSPFVQLLQELANRNIPKVGYPILQAFIEFVSDFAMLNDSHSRKNERGILETGKPFSPSMFDSVLKTFTPDLPSSLSGRPRQEDAQEFLSFVMDRMHHELLKLDGHFNSNGGTLPLVSSSEDDGWETVGPKNKSAVTRTQSFIPSELSAIFGGQLRSVVKARGNKDSATVQPYLLLHLDIISEAVHTIEDALHLFSAPETLEGYRASAGKAGVVSASKSVKIQTLSKILILHLMRFSYGTRGSTKLHKPVHFPLELILARDWLVTPSSKGRKYELVATITHHGQEPSKGHYTADARYSDGTWLRYDDSSVTAVGTNKVLHDQAYVLFYKQA